MKTTALAGLARRWDEFWFGSDGRTQFKAFRPCFALILLACYATRTLDLELFYGPRGIVPLDAMPELWPMEYRFSLLKHFTSTGALWFFHGLSFLSLASMGLGFYPRFSAAVSLVLHLSFLHRNVTVAYGTDLVSCFYLFFLCFADTRSEDRRDRHDLGSVLGSVAYRLCQFQVCIIYGYSGLKKLKGAPWWSGDGLWYALANSQFARFDFSWLASFPSALAVLTFLTLAWEIYFPALVWIKPIRLPVLAVGVAMHVGIGIGLSIPIFAALMIATYAFFLDPAQIRWLASIPSLLQRRHSFLKVPRPVAD